MRITRLLWAAMLALQLTACKTAPTSIDVILSDYKFTPNVFTIAAGKEITIHLQNDGLVSHTFIIFKLGTDAGETFGHEDEVNIYWRVEVLPSHSATAMFTAPSAPGQYYVTCGLGGHHEAGMVATLIVVGR